MPSQTPHDTATATATPPLVRCQSVTREYRRSAGSRWRNDDRPTVTALSEFCLSIPRQGLLLVTGPSGSGKSTLLHLIAGLDIPTSGTVEWDGTDLTSLSESQLTRLRLERIGVVFQRFHLLPSLSARANVALPLVERGVGTRARHERATELLEKVGIGDRLDHRPGELSGGEQQRVAIARALVNDPDLVVADEPTGELDTATGENILEILAEAATDRAIVVASHDERLKVIADAHVELRDGKRIDDVTG